MRLALGLVMGLLLPVSAQAGLWAMTADSGACEVRFVEELVDDGLFFVDRNEADCGADINRVTGYSLNEDGAVILLYSTLDGVEQLGQLRREEAGGYAGSFRSGVKLRLDHVSGPRKIANPISDAAMGEVSVEPPEDQAQPRELVQNTPLAAAGNCLRIAGADRCAPEADLGAPMGGEIAVFTKMNIRDQGTTQGSTVVGQVQAGQCLAVTFCSDDAQGRLWCGVEGGFILKQDAKTVYAANGC